MSRTRADGCSLSSDMENECVANGCCKNMFIETILCEGIGTGLHLKGGIRYI